MEDYNKTYRAANDIFGKHPEKVLINFLKDDVKNGYALDIGAGQGRNSFYLAENEFIVDAIDTSEVAVDFIKKNNKFNNLNVFKADFKTFTSSKEYDVILVFGLIQILSYEACTQLANNVLSLSKKGTYLFISSFSEKDDTFAYFKNNFKEYKNNYFVNSENKYRSFPSINEIEHLFSGFKLVIQNEYTGPLHSHGNNILEKHEIIELVFKMNA